MYQKDSPQNFTDLQNSTDQLFFNDMTTREELIATTSSSTLTPTTLIKLESMKGDNLTASTSQGFPSGVLMGSSSADQFLPRVSKFDYSDDDDDDSDDDEESQDSNSNTIRSKQKKSEPEYICMTSAMTLSTQTEQRPARKLPGPRPSRTLEEMTPLEAERRRRRRERNKNAAAKCRQRRLDLTNELLAVG
jgi:hypothetical protein